MGELELLNVDGKELGKMKRWKVHTREGTSEGPRPWGTEAWEGWDAQVNCTRRGVPISLPLMGRKGD